MDEVRKKMSRQTKKGVAQSPFEHPAGQIRISNYTGGVSNKNFVKKSKMRRMGECGVGPDYGRHQSDSTFIVSKTATAISSELQRVDDLKSELNAYKHGLKALSVSGLSRVFYLPGHPLQQFADG